MKIKCMLDRRKFNKKPEGFEVVELQGYTEKKTGIYHKPLLKQDEIEIEDLAVGLANGMTCKPALLGSSKNEGWIQQQIFMIDFDHDTTIREQLDLCNEFGISPVFGYTSFSHSEEEHHFRLVFATNTVITDIEIRNKLQITLIKIFSKSDSVTFDPSRIFYGGCGKRPIVADYNARINVDEIIEKYYKAEYEEKINTKSSSKTKKNIGNKKENPSAIKKITDESYLKNIEAIRNLDVDALRDIIGIGDEEPVIVNNEAEMRQFIKNIDLTEFTGIEIGQMVNCILPDHADNAPSATIYVMNDGTQSYKCFGCGRNLLIISLVEVLSGTTRTKAERFIKEVYEIEIRRSEWVEEQKAILESNLQYLDSDDIKLEFPYLHRLIRTRAKHLKLMTVYFKQFINEDVQLNGKPLFYAGYTKLCEVCGINPNKHIILSQSLTSFVLLSMLVKVELSDIPEKELKNARAIAIKYGFKKITNFYQLCELGYNQLVESEKIAKNLTETNHMTLKGVSREYLLRTFGIDVANRVYPQYKESNKNGTSNKSDKLTMEIVSFILGEIQANGYVAEKIIKVNERVETQYKRSVQEILDTYGLVKIRANQENKAKYGLPNELTGQSCVIVKAM